MTGPAISRMTRSFCLYNITVVVLQPFTDTFPAGIARAAGVLMAQEWLLHGNGTYAPSFADPKLQEVCVNFVFMNDNFDSNTAAEKIQQAEMDYAVAACIGPSGSDLSKRVSQEAAQMTPVMPVVGVSGTATSLSNKVKFPNFFRMAPPDDVVSRAIVEFAVYLEADSVGCIYATGAEYPRSIGEAINNMAPKAGIATISYTYTDGSDDFDGVVKLAKQDGAPRYLAIVASDALHTFLLLKRLYEENFHATRVLVSADILASGQPAKIPEALESRPTGAVIFTELRVVAFKAEGAHERLDAFKRDWPTLVRDIDLKLLESVNEYAMDEGYMNVLPAYVPEAVRAVLYLAHAAHAWLSGSDAQNLQSAMKLLTGHELDSIYGTLELNQNHDPIPDDHVVKMYRFRGTSDPISFGSFDLGEEEFNREVASAIEDLPCCISDSSDSSGPPLGLIAAGISSVVVVLGLCFVGFVLHRRFCKAPPQTGEPIPEPVDVEVIGNPEPPVPAPPPFVPSFTGMRIDRLIALVVMGDLPLEKKMEIISKLFESKNLKKVADENLPHAEEIKKILHGNLFRSGEVSQVDIYSWRGQLLNAITTRSLFGRELSHGERDNLTMLLCAVLSLEGMSGKVKDVWEAFNGHLNGRPVPRVTHDVVKFIKNQWERLCEEDTQSFDSRVSGESNASTECKRQLLEYLLAQPPGVVMETFEGSCTPASPEILEGKYPFLALARFLCRQNPKVLGRLCAALRTPSTTEMEAAISELLPQPPEDTDRLTDEARVAVFMILNYGCSPDPLRHKPLAEPEVIGCLIAWGIRGSVSRDGAGRLQEIEERGLQTVLQRVRGCSDKGLRRRTLNALLRLNLKDISGSVGEFAAGLLQIVIDQNWPVKTDPPIDRQTLVSFMQALPFALRNRSLPEKLVWQLKEFVVQFVEEGGEFGLQIPEKDELTKNLCYDDGLL
mmetsp:Transcript_37998/g.87826  ORF Transcript_37998/g.87826 Transcript_37998/m.87826 type:complete len:951 (-) Transcript_37998:629-3481(-)